MLSERSQTQKVKLSHLVEIQEQAKLYYSDRNQNNGNLCVIGIDWKEAQENFLGRWEHSLYLK